MDSTFSLEKMEVVAPAILSLCQIFADSSHVPLIASRLLGTSTGPDLDNLTFTIGTLVSTPKPKRYKRKKAKAESRVSRLLTHFTDFAFKHHFRLSRTTVELLLGILPPNQKESKPGRPPIKKEVGILLSLWTLGNKESFREIAERFGLSPGHAYREFVKFCFVLCAKKEQFITWPKEENAIRTMQEFSMIAGESSFPNVLGCIGSTHIKISSYKQTTATCEKSKEFLQLHAVCDATGQFTSVFACWPGSADSGQLGAISSLFQIIVNWEELKLPLEAHLIGDVTYPLHEHLMIPYSNEHSIGQKHLFNAKLNSTRSVIDRAIDMLFRRFRRLRYLHVFRKELPPRLVVAACILHNLCIIKGDVIADDIEVESVEHVQKQSFEFDESTYEYDRAVRKRDEIAQALWVTNAM